MKAIVTILLCIYFVVITNGGTYWLLGQYCGRDAIIVGVTAMFIPNCLASVFISFFTAQVIFYYMKHNRFPKISEIL